MRKWMRKLAAAVMAGLLALGAISYCVMQGTAGAVVLADETEEASVTDMQLTCECTITAAEAVAASESLSGLSDVTGSAIVLVVYGGVWDVLENGASEYFFLKAGSAVMVVQAQTADGSVYYDAVTVTLVPTQQDAVTMLESEEGEEAYTVAHSDGATSQVSVSADGTRTHTFTDAEGNVGETISYAHGILLATYVDAEGNAYRFLHWANGNFSWQVKAADGSSRLSIYQAAVASLKTIETNAEGEQTVETSVVLVEIMEEEVVETQPVAVETTAAVVQSTQAAVATTEAATTATATTATTTEAATTAAATTEAVTTAAATTEAVTEAATTAGRSLVASEWVADCDGSGNGYWIHTYSDGSIEYEDVDIY